MTIVLGLLVTTLLLLVIVAPFIVLEMRTSKPGLLVDLTPLE